MYAASVCALSTLTQCLLGGLFGLVILNGPCLIRPLRLSHGDNIGESAWVCKRGIRHVEREGAKTSATSACRSNGLLLINGKKLHHQHCDWTMDCMKIGTILP